MASTFSSPRRSCLPYESYRSLFPDTSPLHFHFLFLKQGNRNYILKGYGHTTVQGRRGSNQDNVGAIGKVDLPSYVHTHSPSHQKAILVERVQFPLFLSSIKQPSDSQPQMMQRKGCPDGQYEQVKSRCQVSFMFLINKNGVLNIQSWLPVSLDVISHFSGSAHRGGLSI